MNLRFAILALVHLFSLNGVVCAQLPPRLERCLPYPTLAQEISAMQEETRAQERQSVPTPTVVIASIQFASATHISEFVRNRIIWSIKSPQFHDEPNEEITKLYATKGYIDMVPEPKVLNDDDGGPIDLVVRIDEGKQYRLGKIEFLGLDESSQNQLKPQLRPGEPFNKALVDELLKRNTSVLPADASWQDVLLTRNAKEGVVDVRFDFYSCPRMSTPRASSR